MKKLLSLLLIAISAISLASCAGDSARNNDGALFDNRYYKIKYDCVVFGYSDYVAIKGPATIVDDVYEWCAAFDKNAVSVLWVASDKTFDLSSITPTIESKYCMLCDTDFWYAAK